MNSVTSEVEPILMIDSRIADSRICNASKANKADATNSILKQISAEKYPDNDFILSDDSRLYIWIFGLAASLVIFMIFLILITLVSFLTKKKYQNMKTEWLETFHAGQENLIDWNEDIVLQAGFLPYRSEFEFSFDDIIIGDELASGNFGVVFKAIAKGLGPDGSALEVAVKKTKSSKLTEIKAFADELKIMMFLQKVNKESHINIINLLGSVTVDIKKGQIYAILELCEHGSLKDFIVKNFRQFVNEFDNCRNITNLFSGGVSDNSGEANGYTA